MEPAPATSPSAASSTVTSSSISFVPSPPPIPFHLLEISLISAQDLAPVSKSMRTYAVAWIEPTRKVTTRSDQNGNSNPTWNDRFEFRIENESLLAEDTSITVEIYTASWFREILVGTVRVVISDLIMPLIKVADNELKNTRFVALQVRRPSGNPQGILNLGVSILDNTMRNRKYPENSLAAALKKANTLSKKERRNKDGQVDDMNQESNTKIKLGKSPSMRSDFNNGSMVNGSEVCSDIGPSASIVAAEMAIKSRNSRHSRRNSDGGLFSCFGNVYGIEVSIVCGASNSASGGNKPSKAKSRSRSRSKTTSENKSKTATESESKTSSESESKTTNEGESKTPNEDESKIPNENMST